MPTPVAGLSSALRTDVSGAPARVNADGSTEPRLYSNKLNRKYVFEDFAVRPQFSKADGNGAATGATGDINVAASGRLIFEWHVKGIQTILVPVFDVTNGKGLDFGQDQTAADGHEIGFSPNIVTAGGDRGAYSYKVGSEDPFFARLKILSSDTSGWNPFAFGFRKVQAYATALGTYTDYAVIKGVVSGVVAALSTETNLAGAGAVTTSTGLTKADDVALTIDIRVDAGGKVKMRIDDVPVPVNFTFAAGTIVMPFSFFLQGADLTNNLWYQEFEAGYLPKKAV